MIDGAFNLDGFEFGASSDTVEVLEGGFDPGQSSVRTQDSDRAHADGSLFGRDFYTGPTFTFTLLVYNTEDSRRAAADLAAVWRRDAIRTTPGALSTLRFARAGTTYQVRGRPRDFAVSAQDTNDDTLQVVNCTFKCDSPVMEIYEGAPKRVDMRLVAGSGDGGLVLPAPVPFELRPASQGRTNAALVGGSIDTSFSVTIAGPVSGELSQARVYGGGFDYAITRPIARGQTVVIDTRTQAVTLNGTSTPGLISPKARLTSRLSPGAQSFNFTGSDPTNTATATVQWRDALPL